MKDVLNILSIDQIKENLAMIKNYFDSSIITSDSLETNIESQELLTNAMGMCTEALISAKHHKNVAEDLLWQTDNDFKKLTGNLARDYKNVKLGDYNLIIEYLEKLHKDCDKRNEAARSANSAIKSELRNV